MMWVKICGITRQEDALVAAELGADALGFIFWPGSPRFVDPTAARTIVRALPEKVVAVGVFVDQPAEQVEAISRDVGLRAVQLHGSETADYSLGLTLPVIKAVAAGANFCPAMIARWPASVMVLVDADDPEKKGGTGVTANWKAAAAVGSARRIILAGGLTPGTVADAIRFVRPFGVDVSSGVESRPGVKDSGRLRRFFDAARGGVFEVRCDVDRC
jgi:phosphoribosylanthranilate isomerase